MRAVICPINSIFFIAWRIVRVFLPSKTAAKFELLKGTNWQEQLQEQLGGEVELPPQLRG